MNVPPHVDRRRRARSRRLRTLGFLSYRAYLASSQWALVKARYRASDRPQDCMCGETQVDLHHMTYERVGGDERPEDLIALCRTCHTLVHVLERRGDVTLDFAGFESAARAAAYAVQQGRAKASARADWDAAHGEDALRRRVKSLGRRLRDEVAQCLAAGIDVTPQLDAIERCVVAVEAR